MRPATLFPSYVQRENVVTNATLVLLSQVNRLAPEILGGFLASLTDQPFEIGLSFFNQVVLPDAVSVPDALIRQVPFELYIETKLPNDLYEQQIINHFQSISGAGSLSEKNSATHRYLIAITPTGIDAEMHQRLVLAGNERGVTFSATTFVEIADLLESLTADFRVDLISILAEYRSFIVHERLVPVSTNMLLINPCRNSYDRNVEHAVYHDQPERSKIFCKYLGLYKDKCVGHVGRLRAVVTAIVNETSIRIVERHPLPWADAGDEAPELTPDEEQRIRSAASDSYYDLMNSEVRYYLVDEFVETSFNKVSKYGIRGHRYFELDSAAQDAPGVVPHLFTNGEPTIAELAEALSGKEWK